MRALLAALFVTGCATVPTEVGIEGPVTVILDDWRKTATACVAMGAPYTTAGCVQRIGDGYVILCPQDGQVPLAQCLAHEVRHLVEPAWRHE